MKTLFMVKGLPGSGKSTKARLMIESRPPGSIIRVNRDEIRRMLTAGVGGFNKTTETVAKELRDEIVTTGLKNGLHVIVDDTNFGWEAHLQELAQRQGAKFEVVDLTNVPLETCIAQDLRREHSVGKDVILAMWKKWLAPKPATEPTHNPALPDCVIVDIDGTVAKMNGRGPYEWDRVGEDTPRQEVINMILARWNSTPTDVLFVSGRDSVCYPQTKLWIDNNFGRGSGIKLFMRPQGDMRRDSVVKKELYQTYIEEKYNVVAIFDDRPQVIRECWQALGFGEKVFNVGSGEEF